MRRCVVLLPAMIFLAGCAQFAPAPDASHYVTRYVKAARFADVREDLELAIQNRGLSADLTSRISAMLDRTGRDLGVTAPILGDAVAYSFCSAAITRKIISADPHSVALCPFVVVAYRTLEEPNLVYVAYRRPPPGAGVASDAALRELERMLDSIAREAIGGP